MNYLAIVIAAFFNMVLGFLWYGPLLGKKWTEFNGITNEQMEKAKSKKMEMNLKYGAMFVSSLVQAFFMNWLILVNGSANWTTGALIGAMAWLGFAATVQFANWNFSGKKFGAYLIDTGYFLVSFVVFGALFAIWK